jgi:polyisoprenoid-binding protein YceI
VSPLVLAALALASTFAVDPQKCSLTIHVGKSGVFRFAGHEHEVTSNRCRGEVVAAPDDLGRSSVTLSFETAALQVSEKGEPAGDAPKVQAAMVKLLDTARFPEIRFASTSVTGRALDASSYELQVTGDLTLRGVTRRVTVPVRVVQQGQALTASGRLSVKQSAFGIDPISVAGGAVKVKDELRIDFQIAAAAARR